MPWRSAAVSLLVFAWSLGWILSRHFEDIPPGNDSAYYLVSSKGFALGRPYEDLSNPMPGSGSLLGPPVFPWVLSLYWRVLHPNLSLLKMLIAAVMALAPVAAFHWLRLQLPPALALMGALAFGCSYSYIVQGNSVMTESIYCPMVYLALYLSQRGIQGESGPQETGRKRTWWAMLLWVVIARTRVAGWFFLAVFAALAANRRMWALIAAGAAGACAMLAIERWLSAGVRVMKYTDDLFTGKFPILVEFRVGVEALARNLATTGYDFATSINGHILFPWFYEMVAMSKAKRAACLLVFLWSAWGVWLAWRENARLRPWIASVFMASVPTFLIFESHDSFRYLMPFFPFLFLFFLAPFRYIAAPGPSAALRGLPVAACAVLLFGQAAASFRHDFETEYIDYPAEFSALHDSLLIRTPGPAVCLSPDAFYTYLRTDLPSVHFQGRHDIAYARARAEGKETWALCGPRNEWICDLWKYQGIVYADPPVAVSGSWKLLKVERWPQTR
ncbi:MAG: hypothetical protein M3Y08_14770 [Fibrobacterota bacterium]|nr:hypothetical protein [Fibrobacterota bacterium]